MAKSKSGLKDGVCGRVKKIPLKLVAGLTPVFLILNYDESVRAPAAVSQTLFQLGNNGPS